MADLKTHFHNLFGGDPDNVAAAKDENNKDEKRGDLLVALLSARCLTVPQARVLKIEMFIDNILKRCY